MNDGHDTPEDDRDLRDNRPGLGNRQGPLTEYQTAAVDYRAWGWSAGVFDTMVWVVASRPIEALDVPGRWGERTQEALHRNGVTAPVFLASEHDEVRWVFLTGHRAPTWPTLASTLHQLGVDHIWAGRTLDLPPSRFGDHRLEWVTEPTGLVPDFAMVAEAIIRAAAAETPRP